ncbi:MAG: hypothetical protein ABIJ18_01115 [archaeon]
MKYRYLILMVVITIFLLSSTVVSEELNENDTVEDVSENLLTLEFDRTKFAENSNLEGTAVLSLKEKVSVDENFKVSVGNVNYVYSFLDLLDLQEYNYTEQQGDLNATTSSATKEIHFTQKDDAYLALQLPRYAIIKDVSMDLSTDFYSDSYPTNVTIDFGDEGNVDWYYFGDFVRYGDNWLKSKDFDDVTEETIYLVSNDNYYCEMIDVPETKHINFSAEYTKLGSVGDLKAVILSAPSGDPTGGYEGGIDICDLPENGGSCEIELDYPIEGTYLFCVYSEDVNGETQLYELPVDSSSQTTTSFVCPISETGLCTKNYQDNFVFKVKAGYYDKVLDGNINFTEWETFSGAVMEGIKFYIGTEPYDGICEKETCVVPIKIHSDTAGAITLNNLKITYDYYNQDLEKTTTSFYSLEIPSNLISVINGDTLVVGTDVDIDLSKLNISLDKGTYDVEVNFLGNTASSKIEVVSEDEYFTAEDLISEGKSKFASFLNDKVIEMLGYTRDIEAAKENLENYEEQIGFVDDLELLENVENQLIDLPWDVVYGGDYSDKIIIEPIDIPDSVGGDEVYFMQDNVDIYGTANKVWITYYNGDVETYRYVEITVEAKEDLENLDVYVVSSTPLSSLMFIDEPTSVSTYVGKYSVGSLGKGDIVTHYYLAPESDILSDFRTFVYAEEEVECEIDDDCNDGFECVLNECLEKETSYLWLWIIIIILVLGGSGYGVYYFLSKKKTKKVIPKKDPESEISKFIKVARKKGVKDKAIIQLLEKKGWKKAEIEKEMRRK